jgi:hypothetical protein
MELEGFIAETKKRWMDLPTTTNHTCQGTGAAETSDTTPLGLDRFEGIFIILAVVIVLSVAWGFVSKTLAARTNKPDNDELAPGDAGDNNAPPQKIAAEEPGESSVIKLIEEMRAEMRAEMAEMKTTLYHSHLAGVQTSSGGQTNEQTNGKLSPSGNGAAGQHDDPSSAAVPPEEEHKAQQPKVPGASQGSVVFGWPWMSSPPS